MFGTQSDISADRDGTAAGRDIVGIPPEHLPAIIAAATASHERLNAELQASVAELQRQLGAIGSRCWGFSGLSARPGLRPRRSRQGSSKSRGDIRRSLLKPRPSRATTRETARLKAELHAALERPDLERADALLAEILSAQDRDLARRALRGGGDLRATWRGRDDPPALSRGRRPFRRRCWPRAGRA